MASHSPVKDYLEMPIPLFAQIYGAIGRVLDKQRKAREEGE